MTIPSMFVRSLTLLLSATVLAFYIGCSSEPEGPSVKFPVDVGERPQSITKGFGDNYFVTVMNGREDGDGDIQEIITDNCGDLVFNAVVTDFQRYNPQDQDTDAGFTWRNVTL